MTPYYDDRGLTKDGRLGQDIYHAALEDRRGFSPEHLGIDYSDEAWIEIFEAIGAAARRMMEAREE